MNYYFHPDAEKEFLESIEYYEGCATGLGFDFASEVYDTIIRIKANPEAWQVVIENIRRCLVNRFPFGILYVKNDDGILILAVMHLHRNPDYWKSRT
jgi:hypothetical protein